MSAGLAMGLMDYSTMLSKSVLYTMSRAWQLGRAVLRARHTHTPVLAAVAEQQHGLLLIRGKVRCPCSTGMSGCGLLMVGIQS